MGLNRKGTVALIDAMVFLSIMSLVAVGTFAYTSNHDVSEPMAKSVCDDLFSMKMRTSDLTDSNDSKTFPIAVLIAANMSTGDTDRTYDMLKGTLDGMIPEFYGYLLIIEYRGSLLSVERDSSHGISSEYGSSIHIDGAGELNYRLIVL